MSRRDLGVGLFVLATVAGAVAVAIWARNLHFGGSNPAYYVDLSSVAGLEVGAPVLMGGFQVGEIREIKVETIPALRFELELRISRDVPIPEGTVAFIASRSLTGGRMLELRPPEEQTGGFHLEGARLPSDVDPSVGDVIARANQAFEDMARVTRALREFAELGRDHEGGFAHVVVTIERTVADLGAASRQAESLLATLEGTVERVTPSLDEGSRNFAEAMKTADTAVKNVDTMLQAEGERLGTVIDEARARLVDLEAVMKSYRSDNFEDLNEALANLNRASADLAELMEALKKRPFRTIRKGVEVPD